MAGDAHWSSVALYLRGNGADNQTVIADSSASNRSVTTVGGAKIMSNAIAFDGSGDYLTVAHASVFGAAGDFTVEATVIPAVNNAASGITIACKRDLNTANGATDWIWLINSSGKLGLTVWGTGAAIVATAAGTTTLPVNQETHVRATKQGSTWRLFVGGVLEATVVESGAIFNGTGPLGIGVDPSSIGLRDFNGRMKDIRVTSGVARSTATFTPEPTPYPLGVGQVVGSVKDEAGAGVVRTVRAYRRDTGALVASTASDAAGSYSFYTPTLDELSVICLDDAGGTLENDRILRVIPA